MWRSKDLRRLRNRMMNSGTTQMHSSNLRSSNMSTSSVSTLSVSSSLNMSNAPTPLIVRRAQKTLESQQSLSGKPKLYLVLSIGKTASTSLLTAWAKQLTVDSVVLHTHNMAQFTAVEREPGTLLSALRHKHSLFGPRHYLFKRGSGLIDYRFRTNALVTWQALRASFGSVDIVGCVRNPIARRVSSILNDFTPQAINSAIDTFHYKHLRKIPEDRIDLATIVGRPKTYYDSLSAPLAKTLLQFIQTHRRLPRCAEVWTPLRAHMYSTTDYSAYFELLEKFFGRDLVNFPSLQRGYSWQAQDTAGNLLPNAENTQVDAVRLFLFRFEMIDAVKPLILRFMQVPGESLSHERNHRQHIHLIRESAQTAKQILERLVADIGYDPSLPPARVQAEVALCKQMGY